MLQVTVAEKVGLCVMHTHLMNISQAELEYFVSQDAAGICKAEQGMVREDSLHSVRAVPCILLACHRKHWFISKQIVLTKDGAAVFQTDLCLAC